MLLSKKDLTCFYQIAGQFILANLKHVTFGILMEKNILICIMGIGTNTLGYGNKDVDEAVQTVFNGNVSTFNCPEEVFLAEKIN